MQNNPHFQYTIAFSRRRTLSIIVSPDKGVCIKAPYRTPVKTVEKFIQEKSGWIVKTLNGFKVLARIDNRYGYSEGDSVLLFGREHKLKLSRAENYSVRLGNNNTIEVTFREDNNPLIIRALLEDWFKFVAREKLPVKFREILVKYRDFGFSPTGFTVRTMKKRWGSCSSKNKIAISYDLIRLDEKYGEYVIIHELCHLKHHNHGAGFYALLSEVHPEWKRVREDLKKYIR
jgi:predicted metal-dependent hydrolase